MDITVTDNSNTYYPWRMNSAGTATENIGRNDRDNLEKVEIENPTPCVTYSITVDYVGSLTDGNGNSINSQDFSLIISGVNNCGSQSANNNLVITTNIGSGIVTEHANQLLIANNKVTGLTTTVDYLAGEKVLL